MLTDERFPQVVSLACHDLRTPLATIYGFARTLLRSEELDGRSTRFLGMIEEASQQLTVLLDLLGIVARIEAGRWEPILVETDSLQLATSVDDRIAVSGAGESVQTDALAAARSLEALASAALRHGPAGRVTWIVQGKVLELAPVTGEAAPVVTGVDLRDFGAIVARRVLEELGASLALDGEILRVRL